MAQLSGGRVRVENGSKDVKHVWSVFLKSRTGTFEPGDECEWPAGNLATGTVTNFDAYTGELRFFRITGTVKPLLDDLIENKTRAGAGTIDSLGFASPPDWDSDIGSPLRAFLLNADSGVAPLEIDLGSFTDEKFLLENDYPGADLSEVAYAIHSDFSSVGLPEIGPTDSFTGMLAGYGFAEATRRLRHDGARVHLANDHAFNVPSGHAQMRYDTIDEDIDTSWVSGTTPFYKLTVPVGVIRVDLFASIGITTAPGDTGMLSLNVEKNASDDYEGAIRRFVWATEMSAASFGIPVVAGDVFTAYFEYDTENTDLVGDHRCAFAIRAAEYAP